MKKALLAVVGLAVAAIAAFIIYARAGGLETDPSESMARYGGPPSQFLDVGGTRVHYRDEGTGPVLVLLHGSRASLHQWDGWVKQLGGQFRIVRLDSMVHGLTGPDANNDYTGARQQQMFKALLDHLKIDRFFLSGTSSGSTEAVRFAAENPGRVERMVLSTVPLRLPATSDIPFRRRAILWTHENILGSYATDIYWREFLEGIFADPSKVTDEWVTRYRMLNSHPGQAQHYRQRISSWYASGGAEKDYETAAKITTPTLILWGQAGPVLPVELHCQIADAFKSAEVRVISYPNLGHKLVMEDPVTTAEAARVFFTTGEGGKVCKEEH